MKKFLIFVSLCFCFLLNGCKSNADETINTILNMKLGNNEETMIERIDTMAHTALVMNELNMNLDLLDKYISPNVNQDYCFDLITKLATYETKINKEIYSYLSNYVFYMNDLSSLKYYEPFEIMGSLYTKKELVDTKGELGNVLRITYDSPNEFLVIDIPYEFLKVNKQDMIYAYPGQAVITVDRGRVGKKIDMSKEESQLFYIIVSTLENIYYYEYDTIETQNNN